MLSPDYDYIFFFFLNDTATTEIYTLSLHDALPISPAKRREGVQPLAPARRHVAHRRDVGDQPHDQEHRRHREIRADGKLVPDERRLEVGPRSEEHTSELQSQSNLVCRLLLEKKKKK